MVFMNSAETIENSSLFKKCRFKYKHAFSASAFKPEYLKLEVADEITILTLNICMALISWT